MSEQFKSYYAIIPANIRYDDTITPNAKLLYGEITALCNEKGYCWATNEYFAQLYNVSKVSISKWVKQLIDGGYIQSEIIYKEGTKEILNRYITINPHPIKEKFNTSLTKVNDPIKQKLNTPIKEKFKDNNTLINNTSNNTINTYVGNENFPWNNLLIAYNDLPLKDIRNITDKRKTKVKARMNSMSITFNDVIQAVNNIKLSKFLQGENRKNWIIDFDWLFDNDTNFTKVWEGKYTDKEGKNGGTKQNIGTGQGKFTGFKPNSTEHELTAAEREWAEKNLI